MPSMACIINDAKDSADGVPSGGEIFPLNVSVTVEAARDGCR
jgi:hypothetical protein